MVDFLGTGADANPLTPKKPIPIPAPENALPTLGPVPDTSTMLPSLGLNVIPPAPQPQAPQAQPSFGQTTFSPDANLIGTQINPNNPGDTSAARSQYASLLSGLNGSLPNRQDIAQKAYNDFSTNLGNTEQLGIQNIGREAAAAGRLGSGMVSTSLGDLQTQLANADAQARSQLAQNVAGETLNDRLAALGASGQGLNLLSGLDTNARNELRGERGYQYGLNQDALQNSLQQYGLEQGAQQQAFNQNQAVNDLLAQISGGGVNPLYGAISGMYGQNASDAFGGAGDILKYLFANQGA